jgi:hypothetical protein
VGANAADGRWWAYDANTGATESGTLVSVGAGPSQSTDWWVWGEAADGAITSAWPWTWATTDRLSGHLSFPVAPGY